jgi:hypothetical protein
LLLSSRQQTRSRFFGGDRNPIGALPGKQTPLRDFSANFGVCQKRLMEKKGEFAGGK